MRMVRSCVSLIEIDPLPRPDELPVIPNAVRDLLFARVLSHKFVEYFLPPRSPTYDARHPERSEGSASKALITAEQKADSSLRSE
jgi:hypothetical protein